MDEDVDVDVDSMTCSNLDLPTLLYRFLCRPSYHCYALVQAMPVRPTTTTVNFGIHSAVYLGILVKARYFTASKH